MAIEGAPSLRDTLEANYDAVEKIAPVELPAEAPAAATPAAETATASPAGATDTRARDDQGRFVEQTKATVAKPAVQTAPAAPAARKRPSSWKAELDPHWEKLPKEVQDEIERREGDFVKGVSTYKQEYDRVKPIEEALKPYQAMMQQHNVKPEQFVSALASTHQTLISGSAQDKLKAFAKFAQDYQIPLHELLVQGDDGKVYLNQAYFQQNQKPAAPQPLTREEFDKLWAQKMQQSQLQQHINGFIAAKNDDGTPRFPHYKEVWTTMDGLLRSELVKDLPQAYAVALALPQHSALAALQPQQRTTDEAEKARQAADVAARAKRNAVSTRTSTPTELVTDKRTSQKGLRAQLEDNFDAFSTGGRI